MQGIAVFMFAVLIVAAAIVASDGSAIEGFAETDYCGNILVQKGSKIVLKNTAKAEIPGVNPIVFDNLEDYVEYMQWIRSQGVNCPVLYLREQYDAQNECSYKLEPDPSDPGSFVPTIGNTQSGNDSGKLIDANHTKSVFNRNDYPGFDPSGQDIGKHTPLDVMNEPDLGSDAMQRGWKGVKYSKDAVASGEYKDDVVLMRPA
jgi:hypothetical protein